MARRLLGSSYDPCWERSDTLDALTPLLACPAVPMPDGEFGEPEPAPAPLGPPVSDLIFADQCVAPGTRALIEEWLGWLDGRAAAFEMRSRIRIPTAIGRLRLCSWEPTGSGRWNLDHEPGSLRIIDADKGEFEGSSWELGASIAAWAQREHADVSRLIVTGQLDGTQAVLPVDHLQTKLDAVALWSKWFLHGETGSKFKFVFPHSQRLSDARLKHERGVHTLADVLTVLGLTLATTLSSAISPSDMARLVPLAGVSCPLGSGWHVVLQCAVDAGRTNELLCVLHSFLGDEAPSDVRKWARAPDWYARRGEAQGGVQAFGGEQPDPWADAPSSDRVANEVLDVLGALAWRKAIPSPGHPLKDRIEHAARGRTPQHLAPTWHGALVEFAGGVSVAALQLFESLNVRWDPSFPVAHALAARWVEHDPDAITAVVNWLICGIGVDPFCGAVLARISHVSEVALELDVWIQATLPRESTDALHALITLDLLLWQHKNTTPRLAMTWAHLHGHGFGVWIAELLARTPDDIATALGRRDVDGDIHVLRAQRRVLERLPRADRDRWCALNPASVLRCALAGGPVPTDLVPWLEILSPDATPDQVETVRLLARGGSVRASHTLSRFGWAQ